MNKIIVLLLLPLLYACQPQPEEATSSLNTPVKKADTTLLKYSKCFELIKENDIKKLIIRDPFLNYSVQQTVVLVKEGQQYTPLADELIISIPIQTIIPFSTSYLSMLDTLGVLNSIIAVENKNYIYNPSLLARITDEKVKITGNIEQLNIEAILLANPSVLVTIGSPGETPKQLQKLKKAGIPAINNYDWKENHPLGKAEWIKFFGALYDKDEEANRIFDYIEANYNQLKNKPKTTTPNVLFSSLYNGIWYVPGGNSYGSQFLKDAGGTYPWISDTTTGSIILSFETIANKQANPDIWLSPNYSSINDMINDDSRYAPFFKAVKNRVYIQDKRTTPMGGNDYWEKGALRADLVLKDYIELFKLDSCNDESLYFFKTIKP